MPDSIGGMGSMKISDVMDESRIDLKLKGKTKMKSLKKWLIYLTEAAFCVIENNLKNDVYFRESEGVTGMGDGLAIPHGKSKVLRKHVSLLEDHKRQLNGSLLMINQLKYSL